MDEMKNESNKEVLVGNENNTAKKDELTVDSFENAIFEMKGKELLGFIKDVFQKEKKSPVLDHKGVFKILETLDDVAIEFGIARMKLIEEENDTKAFPYIISIVVAILPHYKTVLDSIGGEGSSKITMLVVAVLFLILIGSVTSHSKKNSQTVVYFKSLLESAKESKKNKKN